MRISTLCSNREMSTVVNGPLRERVTRYVTVELRDVTRGGPVRDVYHCGETDRALEETFKILLQVALLVTFWRITTRRISCNTLISIETNVMCNVSRFKAFHTGNLPVWKPSMPVWNSKVNTKIVCGVYMRGNAPDKSENIFAHAHVKCSTARVSWTLNKALNVIHNLEVAHARQVSGVVYFQIQRKARLEAIFQLSYRIHTWINNVHIGHYVR